MIPQSVIEEISQLPIESVIGDFITLKKQGTVFKGKCPFHQEKTPSFTVNPNKGIYKCFGCGKGGGIISFVMEHERLSFPQAVRFICDKYKVEYKDDSTPEQDAIQRETDQILKINREVADYYISKMDASKSFERAKERGFLDSTIKSFEMGHAPGTFTAAYKHLLEKGYTVEEILKAGICKEKEGGIIHDYFRDRLVFPIHNVVGKIVGFSARRNSESVIPKYINSPETRVFRKARELFGLYFAKKAIMDTDECIAVEGQTDVISMWQNGIQNVVGSLGTAFTADHAKVIKRYTNNIILLYDGDNAGLKAVFKACEELLKEGMMIYIVQLPMGEDPDSFIKKIGGDAMREYIRANKKEMIEFKMSLLSGSIGDKIKLAKELQRLISLHPDQVARDILLHDYSKKFGFATKVPAKQRMQEQSAPQLSPEFHLLRVYLVYGKEWNLKDYFAKDGIADIVQHGFENREYAALFERIVTMENISPELILHGENEDLSRTAQEIINTPFAIPEDDDYDVQASIFNFELYVIEKMEKIVMKRLERGYKNKMSLLKIHKEDIQERLLKLVNSKTLMK